MNSWQFGLFVLRARAYSEKEGYGMLGLSLLKTVVMTILLLPLVILIIGIISFPILKSVTTIKNTLLHHHG
jgi:hypothetical protein